MDICITKGKIGQLDHESISSGSTPDIDANRRSERCNLHATNEYVCHVLFDCTRLFDHCMRPFSSLFHQEAIRETIERNLFSTQALKSLQKKFLFSYFK